MVVRNINPETSAQAVTEGAILGLYTFNRHISKKSEQGEIEVWLSLTGIRRTKPVYNRASPAGKILAEAANLARDMVNEPANYMTPTILAEEAKKLLKNMGLKIEVLEREQMQELGMGACSVSPRAVSNLPNSLF